MANNNNLNNIPYAHWLENSLQELIRMPIKGICLAAVTDRGEVYANYHEISMMDKITLAGVIQQDAMLDTLAANGFITYEEDSADGKEEE